MTHSDIYTKFMIEYDKANITSSYPSLTEYEIATILDKAYLALIAQKLTGNNPRRSAFESDVKAIEDLRPLIKQASLHGEHSNVVTNEYIYSLNIQDYLYYISSTISLNANNSSIDNQKHIIQSVSLISHENANKFKSTSTNLPWVKNPVCYIDNKIVHVLIDPYDVKNNGGDMVLDVTYIKTPNKFVKGTSLVDFGDTELEINDAMAEELVNLAIIMSTEIAESSRLSTKINTRPLES